MLCESECSTFAWANSIIRHTIDILQQFQDDEDEDDVDVDAFYASLGSSLPPPIPAPKKPSTPARSSGARLSSHSIEEEDRDKRSSVQSEQSRRESTGSDQYTWTFETEQSPFRPRRIPLEDMGLDKRDSFGAYASHHHRTSDTSVHRDGINDLRESACKKRESYLDTWEQALNARRDDLQKLEEAIDTLECGLEERSMKCDRVCLMTLCVV